MTATNTNETTNIEALFPPKLMPLFEPHRFKIIFGGRGGGKSWAVARALLLLGHNYPMRVLCCREIMQSIDNSVHRLLSDQIYDLGLEDFYRIERHGIQGLNGTEFFFAGLKSNVQQVKSYEGLTILWAEESANVSELSLDTIIPTMRGPGYMEGTPSEIWITFNPENTTDAVYKKFIVNPPDNALLIEMNWRDNPWFPDALMVEMEAMKRRDYEKYLHIYEGHCRKYSEGAVYLHEMRQAEDEDRITRVPYDSSAPTQAFLDLGYADATAIWIAQKVRFETHFIHYIENSRKPLDWYLKELSLLPYPIDHIWLPHDARAVSLGTGKSIEESIRAKGYKVSIVPRLSIAEGINAVRQTFPNLFIDRKNCEKGLEAIRQYRFEVKDHDGGFKDAPVHDRFSHGADSARYACVGLKTAKDKPDASKYNIRQFTHANSSAGWMK